MKAVILACTLKPSTEPSNSESLARLVEQSLIERSCQTELIRIANHNVLPGVTSDEGDGDDWPAIRQKIVDAEILIIATPTWAGQMSSNCQKVIERMDAMMSETKDDGTPICYNKVAGVVVMGNEDGAHHIIANVSQALMDYGFTIPAQAWTYWNMGPGPGPEWPDTDHGHDYAQSTGEAMAANLIAVAHALQQNPIPKPPNA